MNKQKQMGNNALLMTCVQVTVHVYFHVFIWLRTTVDICESGVLTRPQTMDDEPSSDEALDRGEEGGG